MEEILIEIGKQSPVISVLVYWIYSLKAEKKDIVERSNLKEDNRTADEKILFERMITAITAGTTIMESNRADHEIIKNTLSSIKNFISDFKNKAP